MNSIIDASPDYDVVIIGAGISGLTAAHFLRKQGYNLLVLEKNDRIGGRTFLKQRHGVTYAVGTQYLGEPQAALQTIYQDFGLTPRKYPAPFAGGISQGKLYLGDEGMLLRAAQEAGVDSINRFVELIYSVLDQYTDLPDTQLDSPLDQLDRATARDWFVQAGINDALINQISVEARSIFSVSLDEISALEYLAIAPFAMPVGETIDSDRVQSLRQQSQFTPEGTNWYGFPEGIFEIVRAIADSLGNSLQLGCETLAVERESDGCLIRFRNASGQETSICSRAAIVALQAPSAQKLVGASLEQERQEILDSIQYAPLAIVSLFSQEPIFDQSFILNLPEGGRIPFLIDATWFRRGYGYAAPDSMRVLNALVVPLDASDRRILTETDAELVEVALSEVEQVFPGARQKVIDTDVTRHDYYGAYMPLGGYERMLRFHALNQPPIVLAGDYLRAAHFQAAAETGRIAALKVGNVLSTSNAPSIFM